MRLLLISIFLSINLITSCSKKTVNPIPSNELSIERIDQFLSDWHQAASDADYDAYFKPIAENGIYVGTDKNEVWTKEAFSIFAKPYFDKGRAWEFKAINRNIYSKGDQSTYYFNETLDTWMGVCRGSGILQKNQVTGDLEILQYVLSLTIPNENIRQVMDVIDQTED